MATWITQPGILLNELNGKNLRNVQQYQHIIMWAPDPPNEVLVSGTLTDGITQFPKGLKYSFAGYTIPITGLNDDVDGYHPEVMNYLDSGFQLSGDEWADIDVYRKATIQDIREQSMHYTGKTWGQKGLVPFYKEGNELLFNFTITLNTLWTNPDGNQIPKILTGDFTIKVVPNLDPAVFVRKYGLRFGFVNDKSEKINTAEYESMMLAKGFDFLTIDRKLPN